MAREHLAAQLDGIQRKSIAMGGESLRKKFAATDDDWNRVIGRVIERALELAGMQKGEAAAEMGYGTNQAPLSRWIAGVETAQFQKLWRVERLRTPIVLAWSEQLNGAAEIVTTITIRRSA
jgi:hypothetical protein